MRVTRATPIAILAMLSAWSLAGCSSPHAPPTLVTATSTIGTRATYAGVAVTVPATWNVAHQPPAFCGSITGRAAYFFVGPADDSTAPGCSASAPTGPYVSVECQLSGTPLSGHTQPVGPFAAIVRSVHGETDIYLTRQDITIEIYGGRRLIDQIRSTIGQVAGSC